MSNSVQELFNVQSEEAPVSVDAEKKIETKTDKEKTNKSDQQEIKSEKQEQKEEKPQKKSEQKNIDTDKYLADIEKLKKEVSDNKRWGQERNQSYILAKKRMDKLTKDWIDQGIIDEDSSKAILSAFSDDIEEAEEVSKNEDSSNVYKLIEEKLKKELPLYQRYNKDKNINDQINGFFQGFSLLPEKKQKDLVEYLQEADGADALDRALTVGADFNETIGVGVKKHGDLFKYVKTLNNENKKLKEELSKTKKELDDRYGKVDTRSITTRADFGQKETPREKDTVLHELFG